MAARTGRNEIEWDTPRRAPMVALAEELLGALPDLEVRPMFGGYGLYSRGVMFGILDDGVFYFKVDEVTRTEYETAGMGCFQASPTQVLRRYYQVPPDLLDDDRELLAWARKAVAVSQTGVDRPRPCRR
jgi:DNA transformation protein and related proteins